MKYNWVRVGDIWWMCKLCYLQALQDIWSAHHGVTLPVNKQYFLYNGKVKKMSICQNVDTHGNVWLILEYSTTEVIFFFQSMQPVIFFYFQGTVPDNGITREQTKLLLYLPTYTHHGPESFVCLARGSICYMTAERQI